MYSLLVILALFSLLGCVEAFRAHRFSSRTFAVHAFDPKVAEQLNEMKARYTRLVNVVSPESEAEAAKLKDVVEKYSTYLEVKRIMEKLRVMYQSENSESRKAKQLKSFMELFAGKVELEELIKEKLGLPANKSLPSIPPEIAKVQQFDAEIQQLKEKLKREEVKIPKGLSTGEARYGSNYALSN